MTLTEFLLARLAEDERIARLVDRSSLGADAPTRPLRDVEAKRRIVELHCEDGGDCATCGETVGYTTDGETGEDYWETLRSPDSYPCDTLRALARPYADHADLRREWRP